MIFGNQSSDLTSSSPTVVAKQRRDGNWNVYEKSRKATTKAKSIWNDNDVISEQGTIELKALGLGDVFDHPKPKALIQRCVHLATSEDDIVLDFFGGSGTTAQAVIEQNMRDGGNRKFILVQLPEPTGRDDFKTISDVTKKRVRKVVEATSQSNAQLRLSSESSSPVGYRVFKLDASNFKPWNASQPPSPGAISQQLDLHVDHVIPGRSEEDILTELLLKSGFSLSTQVQVLHLAGMRIFSVEDGSMLVCLNDKLTSEAIKAMADKKPARVICLDMGFQGNDQLKTNAVQTMKARGVLSFRTV